MTLVYLSLGGNIGNTLEIFKSALKEIATLPGVSDFRHSNIYSTTAVEPYGGIPQNDYLNCACCFHIHSTAPELLTLLKQIESKHGEKPSLKNAPRYLDIDLLFFGTERYDLPDLQIPHPRWQERLFVLIPLLDLTKNVWGIDLQTHLKNFHNRHNERVFLYETTL